MYSKSVLFHSSINIVHAKIFYHIHLKFLHLTDHKTEQPAGGGPLYLEMGDIHIHMDELREAEERTRQRHGPGI